MLLLHTTIKIIAYFLMSTIIGVFRILH